MKLKETLLLVAGLLVLSMLVNQLPFERQSSGLTEVLYGWGEQQEQTSDKITQSVVDGAEGIYVGEHAVNGSNWSIPNIIRHWASGR